MNNIGELIKFGICAVVGAILLWCSVVVVGTGNTGVETCFGTVQKQPLSSGMTTIAPWCEVAMVHVQYKPYKVEAHAGTHDLQKVSIPITVPYTINEGMAPQFYVATGGEDNFIKTILDPGIQEEIKAAAAQFTSEQMVNKREALRIDFENRLNRFVASALDNKGVKEAVTIGQVTIDNVGFDPSFQSAIDAKAAAGVQVEQARNTASGIVNEAQGQAWEIRNKADGEAYTIIADAQQQAAAINREGQALKDSPELVRLQAVEHWNRHLPRVVGQSLPFMNVPAAPPAQPAAK